MSMRGLLPALSCCICSERSLVSAVYRNHMCGISTNWTINCQQATAMELRYYNSEIHKAAFVLPQFARTALKGHDTPLAK